MKISVTVLNKKLYKSLFWKISKNQFSCKPSLQKSVLHACTLNSHAAKCVDKCKYAVEKKSYNITRNQWGFLNADWTHPCLRMFLYSCYTDSCEKDEARYLFQPGEKKPQY